MSDYRKEIRIRATTVSAPYLLDFGKVYFDTPPQYEEGAWEEKLAEQAELFGDRWPEVQEALDALESIDTLPLLRAFIAKPDDCLNNDFLARGISSRREFLLDEWL